MKLIRGRTWFVWRFGPLVISRDWTQGRSACLSLFGNPFIVVFVTDRRHANIWLRHRLVFHR